MNLKIKFSLAVTGLVTLVVLGSGAMTIFSERQHLQNEVQKNQRQAIRLLARVCEESLYQNDFILFNYFEKLATEPGFRSAFYVDSNGVIQIHSNPKLIGSRIPLLSQEGQEQFHVDMPYRRKDENGEMLLDFIAPVSTRSNQSGWAHLVLSETDIEKSLRASLLKTVKRIGVITLAFLMLGFVGAIWLAQTLTKPIERIVIGMKKVGMGVLNPIPFPERHDELGWMGREINANIKKLKELDEMKRDFVAGVTHELKSPLLAIESFAAILMKRAKSSGPDSDADLLNTIRNNATRLRKFIDDLLTTARMEAGQIKSNHQSFPIAEAVTEVRDLFMPLANEKGLSLAVQSSPSGFQVYADYDQVLQILTNLVSNAIKFTAKGSVTITLTGEEKQAVITVSDTGPGIPASERNRIFEKFFQGKTGSDSKKGTGLGLSIVKGLVESNGGRIFVFENPGGGSAFQFTLPKA